MISVKQCVILLCCCCLLLAFTGCRSETGNSQQSTTTQQTTTTQQSSTQPSAANSNGPEVTQTVGDNQNNSARNSNAPVKDTTQTVDPCSLITREEISSVQGEEVEETKISPGNSSRLAVSQCYYQTTTPNKSVSLEVTRRLSGQTDALSPREFWEERFERASGEKERERGKKQEADKRAAQAREEEDEGGPPPRRVEGVGDEAFWVGNPIMGALYVLKGNSIIRISVGGVADQGARLERTKTLAGMALKRLKD